MIKLAKSLTFIILFALVVVALFSCGSRKLPVSFSSSGNDGSAYSYLSFDPLAPARETPHHPLDEIAGYPGLEQGGYKLVAVDASLLPASIPAGVRIETNGARLSVVAEEGLATDCYFYLFYPGDEQRPVAIHKGLALDENDLFLAVNAGPGALSFGTARIAGAGPSLRAGEIASFEFASGSAAAARSVCSAAVSDLNEVEDLVTSVNEDATVTLSWTETHPGDYDNNGVVAISDLTPIAQMFGEGPDSPTPGRVGLVDGSGNDSYTGGVYCQGTAYWWALGILEDREGDDEYSNLWYSLGSAPHFAIGCCVDFTGDDKYNVGNDSLQTQTQACARDASVGVFIDGSGSEAGTSSRAGTLATAVMGKANCGALANRIRAARSSARMPEMLRRMPPNAAGRSRKVLPETSRR